MLFPRSKSIFQKDAAPRFHVSDHEAGRKRKSSKSTFRLTTSPKEASVVMCIFHQVIQVCSGILMPFDLRMFVATLCRKTAAHPMLIYVEYIVWEQMAITYSSNMQPHPKLLNILPQLSGN